MNMNIRAIRGMKDVLPIETEKWQWLESHIRQTTAKYGYNEIRLPILEPLALFQRAVGEATDIVSKEMYDFVDKSGDHITLRPEGTSGCVRAIIENNLCYNATQRLWYQGPMFRYERPQKGRLRQFTQLGVETFGMAGADVDAELILMAHDLFTSLGVIKHLRLELNSLGTPAERSAHREALVTYFKQHIELLDEDSLIRLEKNPLRILDSKNPTMQSMLQGAPQLLEYLEAESKQHFDTVCQILNAAGISYSINPRLVRGLDYYTRTVFEWITDDLGSQGTVCGGGRYDGLVELFSGDALPASGFAIGLERLLLLIETLEINAKLKGETSIVVTCENSEHSTQALLLAKAIRAKVARVTVVNDFAGGKLKRQHQRALKSDCDIIITLQQDLTVGIWLLADNQKANCSVENTTETLQSLLS